MNSTKVARITGIVNKGAADPIINALAGIGITDGHVAIGRAGTLLEKKGLFGASERTVMTEGPIEIITLLVCKECEDAALNLVIKTGALDAPGRGMAFSEEVNILKSHEACAECKPGAKKAAEDISLLTEITGICCIVQRGQGNAVARVALDTGTCVPAITFGHGTGVRDKLGILRITIPAEKEVVNIVASSHDADAVMNLMIDVGKLDQPGKGFIFNYPLSKGLVNTKITQGMPKHAASVEQIISVIDQMKGGTGWRQRTGTGEDGGKKRKYLQDLMALSLTCNEGTGEDLVKAAMAVGAAGATISRLKHFSAPDSASSKIPNARENCNMIVSEKQIPDLIGALESAGAFTDKAHGEVHSSPAPKACTFLGK